MAGSLFTLTFGAALIMGQLLFDTPFFFPDLYPDPVRLNNVRQSGPGLSQLSLHLCLDKTYLYLYHGIHFHFASCQVTGIFLPLATTMSTLEIVQTVTATESDPVKTEVLLSQGMELQPVNRTGTVVPITTDGVPLPEADIEQTPAAVKAVKNEHLLTAALCWYLFVWGWNDGSLGPLLPRIQETHHVRLILSCDGCSDV